MIFCDEAAVEEVETYNKFNSFINIAKIMNCSVEKIYDAAFIIYDCMSYMHKAIRSKTYIDDVIDVIDFFYWAIDNPELELNNSINLISYSYIFSIANNENATIFNIKSDLESLQKTNLPESISSLFNLYDRLIDNKKERNIKLDSPTSYGAAIVALSFATKDFANALKDMWKKATTNKEKIELIGLYKKWVLELQERLIILKRLMK